jgi:hypothetical protein
MVKNTIGFTKILLLVVFLAASFFPFSNGSAVAIPVTSGFADVISTTSTSSQVSLTDFAKAVQDGEELVRGVYVDEVMALRVMQQPSGNNGYVSSVAGIATQFKMAETYGTTGLLAHNFAAGSNFSKISEKDIITIVYGDGSMKKYLVTSVQKYQALSPNSATSNFVDLKTDETLTATKLFEKIYKGDPHLVLQTCIAFEKELSWGRLFVIAEPLEV